MSEAEHAVKIVSLFSGCGGMDLGFLSAENPEYKYKIVWANDFDESACATYRKNIGDVIVCGDVWDVDPSSIPDCDVVIGGFPCQDFSVLRGSARPGLRSKRGLLYTKFVEVVDAKRPMFFMAENVKGLLSANDGWAVKKIKEDFENAKPGYDVAFKLVNFADYGVPQNRERVIIVGVRKDLRVQFEFPNPARGHVTVAEALAGVERVQLNNERLKIRPSTKSKLERIPPGCNYKSLPECASKNWRSLVWRRLDPNAPSPTIIAAGGGGTWGYHYSEPRPLTNRERARIQTFPDDFEFIGSISEVRRQIGNAVPPRGIKPFAEAILDALLRARAQLF